MKLTSGLIINDDSCNAMLGRSVGRSTLVRASIEMEVEWRAYRRAILYDIYYFAQWVRAMRKGGKGITIKSEV